MASNSPKKPNLRTLAQQGSQWKLTADIPVYQTKAGVHYARGIADWDRIDTIRAGELVEVASKKTATMGTQGGKALAWDGLWIHLRRVSDGKTWCVQFSDFNQNPELQGTPQAVPVYMLRDTATGQWYTGSITEWDRTKPGYEYISTAYYNEKQSQARKFKRLADVRTHMLVLNGYYKGLPDTDSLPEWMRCSGSLTWPSTMEIVEVDKITKNETNTWETANHMAHMGRLRALTVSFGSSVRAMYKKLEEKNQLGDYPALVVFRSQDPSTWWDYEMDPGEVQSIKDMAKSLGKDKALLIKHQANVCLACMNEATAWMATQLYQGALTSHVISLSTLLECVPTTTTVTPTRAVEEPESLDLAEVDLSLG